MIHPLVWFVLFSGAFALVVAGLIFVAFRES